MWPVCMPLSSGKIMRYLYAYKSTYITKKISFTLEIFKEAKILSIFQMFKKISEYKILFNYINYKSLTDHHYLYPLAEDQIKKCIFCHKTELEASFLIRPHVIPFLLGNTFLLHYEECDDCNNFFGETLECELDKYLKPYRTLGRQKNRKGNYINTVFTPKRSFRYDENKNLYFIELLKDEVTFSIESNTMVVDIKQEKFSPVLVYRAMIKIIFGLLPREHLSRFENLRKWIIDQDVNSKIISPLNLIRTRLPGFPKTSLDVYILHKNISSLEEFKSNPCKENFEYIACIRFGTVAFDIPLFSDLCFEKLKIMKNLNMNLEFSLPAIPQPGFSTDREVLDFSETKKVKNYEKLYFSYDKIIENKI